MSDQKKPEALTPEESKQPAIAIDPALIAAIAAAVVQAIKGSSGPQLDMETLGNVIGQSVAKGISSTTRRKVSIGEYVQSGHSSFHPKPKSETPILRRNCFDNGAWMNPINLFDEEIVLLNKISHSGRYFDRKMEVIVAYDGSEEVLQFRHNNATADQRFDLAQYYGFVKTKHKSQLQAMLERIVEEQEAEDKDAEETRAINEELRAQLREKRKVGMGYSKSYQEAKAKAEARLAEAQ